MSNYAIVQTKIEKIEPQPLAEILVREGGLLRPDAMRVARREQGILWERFNHEQAHRVAAALAQAGFAVRAMPVAQIVQLPRPRTVHWVNLHADGLSVPFGSQDQAALIPWLSMFVISAGEVREIVKRTVQTVERYDRSGSPIYESETETESELTLVTDLIGMTSAGELTRVRLPMKELAYNRIFDFPSDTSLIQRYLGVLEQLVTNSKAALISPPTRRLFVERRERLDSTRAEAWATSDNLVFERYNRWLLQLVIFKEQE